MQVYDSDTDVIVRQRKGCSRNLERILYDIKFEDYIVGTLKIDSLSDDDEVLLMDSDAHTYSCGRFDKSITINHNVSDDFYQFIGRCAVGGSGFYDEVRVCKVVSAKTPIVCRFNNVKKVVVAEELYKLAWVNKVDLYGYCRDISHNSLKLGVIELPLIIDKCCKTVAISSVSIDLPNNLYLLTRKDSDYIF
jgi:hypothetical protein